VTAVAFPATFVVPTPMIATVMFPPFVFPAVAVEPSAVEIFPVVSHEIGAIVFEVTPVPIVATPCRVVIIDITGELGFTNGRRGIISAFIYRGRLFINGGRFLIDRSRSGVNGGRCNIHPRTRDTKTDVGIYIHL